MFIHEQTNQTIHAKLSETIIRATHRPQDLIPAFLEVIRDTAEYGQFTQVIPTHVWDDDQADWWENDAIYVLEELFEILNHYAPEPYYFGAHIGDGSDFGYWLEKGWGFTGMHY